MNDLKFKNKVSRKTKVGLYTVKVYTDGKESLYEVDRDKVVLDIFTCHKAATKFVLEDEARLLADKTNHTETV